MQFDDPESPGKAGFAHAGVANLGRLGKPVAADPSTAAGLQSGGGMESRALAAWTKPGPAQEFTMLAKIGSISRVEGMSGVAA